ncbi:MAG: 30S ribosomal protein S6 [Patescibacteria group bacterium]
MANYELMLIIDSTLTEEQRNESISELKASFEKFSVNVEKEDVWGDKKLAYKINKSDRGFYILYDVNLDGKIIKDISKEINLNRSIVRYMFTRKDA